MFKKNDNKKVCENFLDFTSYSIILYFTFNYNFEIFNYFMLLIIIE